MVSSQHSILVTTMQTTLEYGLYTQQTQEREDPELSFSFKLPLAIMNKWNRCGLTSNFLANYQSATFPQPEKTSSLLSTIINELIENAIKYSSSADKQITVIIKHFQNTIQIKTINFAEEETTQKLKTYIQKLSENSHEYLFLSQLEENSQREDNHSGIGLLTLINDHNLKIGIRIQKEDALYEIHVKAEIETNDL